VNENLSSKLDNLPALPGVYIYRNARGTIIYVGKAVSLRSRVRSYFQESRDLDLKTQHMVIEIDDLEYIVTDNEVEALILESNLVKKNQPRYNIKLKDDKSFPYLKLTVNEPYPRIFITRRIRRDGALYYGPFLPASYARRTIKLVNRYFRLRTCNLEIDGSLPRPCLDYQMNRCLGPCAAGLCTPGDYERAVDDAKLLLSGKTDELVRLLEKRMAVAAEAMNYEAAAVYRDWMAIMREISERQKMTLEGQDDCDIFGYHQEGARLALEVFVMRGGRVIGRREFYWEDIISFNPEEFFSGALLQYYMSDNFIPREMYIPTYIGDAETLETWLTKR
jgi:excinuclease ABC subunit C